MSLRRKIIPLFILSTIALCTRLPSCNMRMSEKKQRKTLIQLTGQVPEFGKYLYKNQPIHYTKMSDCEDKPVVLLVHGSPGSSSAFMDYLADDTLRYTAQVIAVDRPGYGSSGFGKVETDLQKQAQSLLPILRLYADQKVIIAGHSYGGPVVVQMAADYPHLVDGIVIVAGSVAADLELREWWRKPLNISGIRNILPPAFKVSNQEITPLWKELEALEPKWKNITAPVTIIHGTDDNLVPVENAYYAEDMLENSKAVDNAIIKNGNHFILWSRRSLVIQKILALINMPPVPKPDCTGGKMTGKY